MPSPANSQRNSQEKLPPTLSLSNSTPNAEGPPSSATQLGARRSVSVTYNLGARSDSTYNEASSSAVAAAKDSIRVLQQEENLGNLWGNDADFDTLLEWDDTIEKMLQSTEEEFLASQQLELTGVTLDHRGPGGSLPPRRQNPTTSMDLDTPPTDGGPSFPQVAPMDTTPAQPAVWSDELSALKEELAKLREENRRALHEKEELLTHKYTSDGEIAIIRKRLVKSEAENTQLQEKVNQALTRNQDEKEQLQQTMNRELEVLRTELNFKQQELTAAQMSARIPPATTGSRNRTPTRLMNSPRPIAPSPSPAGFPNMLDFYGPPIPSPPAIITESVGTMTDPLLPPVPMPKPEPEPAPTVVPPSPVDGTRSPKGTGSARIPPLPMVVVLGQLKSIYHGLPATHRSEVADHLFAALVLEISYYQAEADGARIPAKLTKFMRDTIDTPLHRATDDQSLVNPDSLSTTPNSSPSLFYPYVYIMSRLTFGHHESDALNRLSEKAHDLLALVLTPEEEEDVMACAPPSELVA
ncbi:hypothetical protein H4R33_001992 [Dimargaris cristalligena]|nr:hypothetical protein H4R33_001992 [Dimargaris cristalligena]